jgi:hypothetical protein
MFMRYFVFCAGLLCLFPYQSLAVAPSSPVAPKSALQPESSRIEVIYGAKISALTEVYAKGRRPVLSTQVFSGLDWVQRTALLNVVCAQETTERCHAVIDLGLSDNALVVRDHALRLLLARADTPSARKQTVARRIIEDDRNYRRGQGLWIVGRAKEVLAIP